MTVNETTNEKGEKMKAKCECADKACPVCNGQCHIDGKVTLYRVDMIDRTGTLFCEACADDAMESGLFTDDEPEQEPEEGDITTEDREHWYQYGKLYLEGNEAELRAKMEADKFWPSVWFISDHGNAHPITLEN